MGQLAFCAGRDWLAQEGPNYCTTAASIITPTGAVGAEGDGVALGAAAGVRGPSFQLQTGGCCQLPGKAERLLPQGWCLVPRARASPHLQLCPRPSGQGRHRLPAGPPGLSLYGR